MGITTINPTTGEALKKFDELNTQQLEAKLELAATTFRTYRHTPFADRALMMTRAAEILEKEKHEFGR